MTIKVANAIINVNDSKTVIGNTPFLVVTLHKQETVIGCRRPPCVCNCTTIIL